MNPQLISLFYSPITPSEKWPEIFDQLHPLVGAKSMGLVVADSFPIDGKSPNQIAATSTNMPVQAILEYNQKFGHYEKEMVYRVFNSTPGEMVIDPGSNNRKIFEKRPDVAFLKKHVGVVDRFGVRLNNERAWHDALAFQYDENRGKATQQEFSHLKPYLPYIAQAVSVDRFYSQIRTKYNAVVSMLDRVNVGMLLVTEDCSIVICNLCAQETIESNNNLQLDSRKKLHGGIHHAELKQKIRDVCTSAKGSPGAVKQFLTLRSNIADDDLLIEISPFSDRSGEMSSTFAGAIILLIDPQRSVSPNKKAAQTLYGLTDAENSVAMSIANGIGTSEIANMRDVSKETIKTQVRSLFEKMRTNSRTGILRKLISISLPFRTDDK